MMPFVYASLMAKMRKGGEEYYANRKREANRYVSDNGPN